MRKLSLLLFLLFFISCSEENKTPSETANIKFRDLFYKKLNCKIQDFTTNVYIYSPHIIGIMISEESSKIEYFRSLGFNTKENALFFESVAKGDNNFQTNLSTISKENKRIKIVIQNNDIKLVAIKKLDESNKPIEPLLYACTLGENISAQKSL